METSEGKTLDTDDKGEMKQEVGAGVMLCCLLLCVMLCVMLCFCCVVGF